MHVYAHSIAYVSVCKKRLLAMHLPLALAGPRLHMNLPACGHVCIHMWQHVRRYRIEEKGRTYMLEDRGASGYLGLAVEEAEAQNRVDVPACMRASAIYNTEGVVASAVRGHACPRNPRMPKKPAHAVRFTKFTLC